MSTNDQSRSKELESTSSNNSNEGMPRASPKTRNIRIIYLLQGWTLDNVIETKRLDYLEPPFIYPGCLAYPLALFSIKPHQRCL